MNGGRILIALLILVGAGGVLVSGADVYSRMLYLGLLLGCGAGVWTWVVGRYLRVQRSARASRANVGDIFEEYFEVENGSPLLAAWIEVANQSTVPFSSGSRLLTLVGPHQRRSYLARTWLTRRGGFSLGPTQISAGDPLGLFRTGRMLPSSQPLVVLPLIFDIRSFLSPPGLLPGGQVIRRRAVDVTPHAAGVREYVHGDALKRIHWPTSMRHGQLMVKEFEQDPQSEVWLFLDAEKIVHAEKKYRYDEVSMQSVLFGHRPQFKLPPSTLEYGISICASLAHYFIQQRRAVGFISSGRTLTMLPAERSGRQEGKILETLAFLEARGEQTLARTITAQAAQLPQGSSAILITVDDLVRRNLHPVVLLLVAQSFGGPPGAEGFVRSLRERRVPVCPVECEADLSSTLSGFSSDFMSQDLHTWQRPPLSHLI
jgi:uncharacterized protein (DUF58 family)